MKSIFTICFLCSFFLTYAQETEEEEADSTVTTFLSEVTISANRWEQNIREVPGRITTINKALIQLQNPQTAADLLGASNNVYIQKSQLGGGSPMIRGFATNRVMLVVDGVRMNNAIFRSGNVQNVISLDPNAIQETEVLFGPGSVMYGSDAIGGVMDFHTLKPAFSQDHKLMFKGNALLRYSSANKERTAHADFNIGLKNWSFLSSITRSIYDDLEMGSRGPVEYKRPDYVERVNDEDVVRQNSNPNLQLFTGYDQWNAMQKISFQSGNWINLTYAFHYSQTSDYARYDRLILREEDELSNAEWYYGPQKWMMHSLNFTYSKPSVLFDQSKLLFAYQDYEESRHNRAFGGSRRTDRTENVKAFSINADLDKQLSDITTLIYGAEFITNNVRSEASRYNVNNGSTEPWSTRYPDDADWRSTAAYLGFRVKPIEKLSINLSGRFTNIYTHAVFGKTFFDFPFSDATLNNNALNGSLGVVLSPNKSLKIYSNLSTGFRAPNVDDIGKVFDSSQGEVVVPNPDLDPEYAYNAEIGFAMSIEKKVELDFAAYHSVINNAIARGTSSFNGQDSINYDGELSRVLSFQNISEIWVAGIQAGLSIKFAEHFSFRTNINYQRGKEKDPETNRDNSPTHIAPLFGSTHLLLTKEKLKLDVYTNYNGEISYENLALTERSDSHLYAKDANGNPYAPSWWTLNFKSSFKINRVLSLDAGIENILDKRYRPYSSGISAPGRNFIISLRATL